MATNLPVHDFREVQILQQMHHPNLIQYVGACNSVSDDIHSPNYLFLVTEFAIYGDLFRFIYIDQPLGWKLRTGILRDAARGVEFLHSHGFIHRLVSFLWA